MHTNTFSFCLVLIHSDPLKQTSTFLLITTKVPTQIMAICGRSILITHTLANFLSGNHFTQVSLTTLLKYLDEVERVHVICLHLTY